MQHEQKFVKDMRAEYRAARDAAAALDERAKKLATQQTEITAERKQKLDLCAALREVLVKTYKVNPDQEEGAGAHGAAAQGEHKSKPA